MLCTAFSRFQAGVVSNARKMCPRFTDLRPFEWASCGATSMCTPVRQLAEPGTCSVGCSSQYHSEEKHYV